MPQPTIFSRRSVASEAASHPTLAPYPAAGTRSANTIHPAGTASTMAASRCSAVSVSALVTQKGFSGAARLYPA